MPLYRYKALDAHGELLDGQMEAASDADVIARLQEQGHMPVEAKLATGSAFEGASWKQWRQRPFAGAMLVQFTQQLATLLGAGQPLDRALGILLEAPEDARSRRVIADIRDTVRGGAPLSQALERQHGLFSRLYVNMVRAGEAGGSLHETLQRLADYLERSQELKGRVINAMIYPAILLVVVGGALLFLLGYVVPQFAQMYESLDVTLPWFTRAVLEIGLLVRQGWIVFIVVPALALLWMERKRRDAAFRLAFDAWLLKRPVVGPLVARLETARLSRTLGTLLRNGVPLLAGLGIARNVLGNRALAGDVAEAAEAVKNGAGLSGALSRNGRFPRLALQMIQVGEESGTLESMLLRTADTFDVETARSIDRMLAALVPVITLLLASVVGVVIIAVLVPLYDLTNAIG
ncbi:type II secretion system F family protein [Stenotrophomonas sp. ATCM1_4]|jgi:general secretion pathway protein F|uniref:Type II secretion system F family protein n=1 Tax=Stenotrophomonas capsici TaxID=3110230 RepID=A0ABU5V5A3_9GAMM|nr:MULTISPECIES: type II secretion system F family protein [unclassified Stenotrophomonas]MBD9535515.1 type II secretion system F family protein [Stenotrophomonas sp. STM01]MEA5667260.1 type II secretion system F family protein [Stenotrophomonas sp. MH1]TDB28605.1 type II secretion system F family protein [Stenotrophomonas sp. ATCM1_4]